MRYTVTIGGVVLDQEDLLDLNKGKSALKFAGNNLIASKMSIKLQNYDYKYDDRPKTNGFFEKLAWYNLDISIYDEEQSRNIWQGRIKKITIDDSKNQITIDSTDYVQDMVDTVCVIDQSNITPAEAMKLILTNTSYLNIPSSRLAVAGFDEAQSLQPTINIKYKVSDNVKCIAVLSELCRITNSHLYINDNVIYCWQWRKYAGALGGLTIKDQDLIPASYSHYVADDDIQNQYSVAYNSSGTVAFSTGSDALSIEKYGAGKLFAVPDKSIESTASTAFKIIFTSAVGAAWAGAKVLERYANLKRIHKLTYYSEKGGVGLGTAVDLKFSPYVREPAQIIELQENEDNTYDITLEGMNYPSVIDIDTEQTKQNEFLSMMSDGETVYYRWSPNSESDLLGYMLYGSRDGVDWDPQVIAGKSFPESITNYQNFNGDAGKNTDYVYGSEPIKITAKVAPFDDSYNEAIPSNILSTYIYDNKAEDFLLYYQCDGDIFDEGIYPSIGKNYPENLSEKCLTYTHGNEIMIQDKHKANATDDDYFALDPTTIFSGYIRSVNTGTVVFGDGNVIGGIYQNNTTGKLSLLKSRYGSNPKEISNWVETVIYTLDPDWITLGWTFSVKAMNYDSDGVMIIGHIFKSNNESANFSAYSSDGESWDFNYIDEYTPTPAGSELWYKLGDGNIADALSGVASRVFNVGSDIYVGYAPVGIYKYVSIAKFIPASNSWTIKNTTAECAVVLGNFIPYADGIAFCVLTANPTYNAEVHYWNFLTDTVTRIYKSPNYTESMQFVNIACSSAGKLFVTYNNTDKYQAMMFSYDGTTWSSEALLYPNWKIMRVRLHFHSTETKPRMLIETNAYPMCHEHNGTAYVQTCVAPTVSTLNKFYIDRAGDIFRLYGYSAYVYPAVAKWNRATSAWVGTTVYGDYVEAVGSSSNTCMHFDSNNNIYVDNQKGKVFKHTVGVGWVSPIFIDGATSYTFDTVYGTCDSSMIADKVYKPAIAVVSTDPNVYQIFVQTWGEPPTPITPVTRPPYSKVFNPTGVARAGNVWVTVGQKTLNSTNAMYRTADNGANWTEIIIEGNAWVDVWSNGSYFLAYKPGTSATTHKYIWKSSDGITWTSYELTWYTSASYMAGDVRSITWDGSRWVALANSFATSADGQVWVAYNGGIYDQLITTYNEIIWADVDQKYYISNDSGDNKNIIALKANLSSFTTYLADYVPSYLNYDSIIPESVVLDLSDFTLYNSCNYGSGFYAPSAIFQSALIYIPNGGKIIFSGYGENFDSLIIQSRSHNPATNETGEWSELINLRTQDYITVDSDYSMIRVLFNLVNWSSQSNIKILSIEGN